MSRVDVNRTSWTAGGDVAVGRKAGLKESPQEGSEFAPRPSGAKYAAAWGWRVGDRDATPRSVPR
jgi:hypothetical protein